MDALIYEIEVTTDVLHGWKATIPEIHIPALGLYINEETCFLMDNPDSRVPGSTRVVKIKDVLLISKLINLKRLLENRRDLDKCVKDTLGTVRRTFSDKLLEPVRKNILQKQMRSVRSGTTTTSNSSNTVYISQPNPGKTPKAKKRRKKKA